MHPTVRDRLEMRARARALGDVGLVRACDADLARFGYGWGSGLEQITQGLLGRLDPPQTTEAEPMPERAVPERPRRGRPPKQRCEHGQVADRCPECKESEE